MNWFYKVCILFIFCSFTSFLTAQEIDFKSDIYALMKDNSKSKVRKKARKFFRILNSRELSEDQKYKINQVLAEFNDRGLYFNSHYVPFFNLFLECHGNNKKSLVFSDLLDFLIENNDVYTDLHLKHLFSNIERFLISNTLYVGEGFSWKCSGDFNVFFEDNGNLNFHFSDSEIILFNHRDTIQFFNAIGDYDIIENIFSGISAESDFLNDDLFVEFDFSNFSLDFKKKFFQIENTSFSCVGVVNSTCQGVYKNQLTSSNKYPSFKSNTYNESLIIFDDFYFVSGLQLKGDDIVFNRGGEVIDIKFQDDNMKYLFFSDNFQLIDGKLLSNNVEFSIQNQFGSIHHPYVQFSYDDQQKKISIGRLSGKRGLNPIRNTLHGLNMYVDRMEIDLVEDNCLLFHYSPGRDIQVLFESDQYFDESRYRDIARFDVNPLALLMQFYEGKDLDREYKLQEFAKYIGLDEQSSLNLLIDLEIFGFIDYTRFGQLFKINPWAFQFSESYIKEYDHDSFMIESLAAIGDTVAEIDLYLNTMDIYRVQKMNITNRFPFNIYPMSNRLHFFKNKSFVMDGNIDIGSFAFSGKNIRFEYDDFSFHFSNNSILSFLQNNESEISSSLIHFDKGVLAIDSLNNKSGEKKLNNFPKFRSFQSSFLSYDNNPVVFLINPFELTYLSEMSLSNLSFSGSLYLDGYQTDLHSDLFFNETNNLYTVIEEDSVALYKGLVKLDGVLDLSEKGLFGSGDFYSKYIEFQANKIEILSGKMVGFSNNIINGNSLSATPFSVNSAMLNLSPYDNKFLIKSIDDLFTLYDQFYFLGDIYFDGENLNGSGDFMTSLFNIQSSHYYYSNSGVVCADANFIIPNQLKAQENKLFVKGVSLEYNFDNNSVLIFSNNDQFLFPMLNYLIDYDIAFFDLNTLELDFKNENVSNLGSLTSFTYGKDSFSYNAFSATYNVNNNELCVSDGIQLELKNFWLQPLNNSFCILNNGEFPIFKNATLIKKRWLLKDKLINNQNVIVKPNLKHLIVAD